MNSYSVPFLPIFPEARERSSVTGAHVRLLDIRCRLQAEPLPGTAYLGCRMPEVEDSGMVNRVTFPVCEGNVLDGVSGCCPWDGLYPGSSSTSVTEVNYQAPIP